METVNHQVDFCVVGGGLSGVCAAIAAARHGAKVALMQDRPVLGGNASSEIRMWVCGAHGRDNRETGILEEIELANYRRNPGLKFPLWDLILYEKVTQEPNITLLLNCSCLDAAMEDGRIASVTGWQTTTQRMHRVRAALFADCSGDSVLAPLTGAEHTYGREGRAQYGESIAPEQPDRKTMGMSCLFQIRETPEPQTFVKPDWANTYRTDDDLPFKDHDRDNNFWWIELGGEDDCIADTERLRHELLKIALGVWDHMKNQGDHGVANWELEWIGMLPGKRESRRYIGPTVVTQHHVRAGGPFPDVVAYGGWTMDDHFPAGFRHTASHPTIYHAAPSPWGIPFSSLHSVNVPNLLFAGRNISVTHTALSSSRVMATCALLGQAVGTAAAQVRGAGLQALDIGALQQTLLADDCFLPGVARRLPELTARACCSHPVLRNGLERGEENCYQGPAGQPVGYAFNEPERVRAARLVFDSDLNRPEHNMPCNYPLKQPGYGVPATLLRDFDLVVTRPDGAQTRLPVRDNERRLVNLDIGGEALAVDLVPLGSWGGGPTRVFGFDVIGG